MVHINHTVDPEVVSGDKEIEIDWSHEGHRTKPS